MSTVRNTSWRHLLRPATPFGGGKRRGISRERRPEGLAADRNLKSISHRPRTQPGVGHERRSRLRLTPFVSVPASGLCSIARSSAKPRCDDRESSTGIVPIDADNHRLRLARIECVRCIYALHPLTPGGGSECCRADARARVRRCGGYRARGRRRDRCRLEGRAGAGQVARGHGR